MSGPQPMSAPQPSRPTLVRGVSIYRGSKILPLLALLAGVGALRRPPARGDRRANTTLTGVLALFLIGAAANAAARPHATRK